ncbi:MAG: S-layer homology domain-containing protein [Clostridia bacterium]|nr:S-layer homology domain-containing protein [Clostridia bacterium]
MKYKVLSILAATMMAVTGVTAFAAPTVEKLDMYGGIVTVSGTLEGESDGKVIFTVWPKNEERIISTISAMGEVQGTGTSYQLSFGLEQSDDYVLVVRADKENVEYPFSSAGVNDLATFVTRVADEYTQNNTDELALGAAIETLFSAPENSLVITALGVDMVVYGGFSPVQKGELFSLFVKNTDFTNLSIDELAKGYAIAEDLFFVNNNMKLTETLQSRNYSFEGTEYTSYTHEKQTRIGALVQAHGPYTTESKLLTGYQLACMLDAVNTEHRVEKIFGVISQYASGLQIQSDPRYTDYISNNNEAWNIKLIQSLSQNHASDAEVLLATINASKVIPSGTTGGTTGGSSSGGGGGLSYYVDDKSQNSAKPETVVQQGSFVDMQGYEWAKDSVEKLVGKGVVAGYGNRTFAPYQYVTREEFIKMIVMALNIPYQDADCSFVDVFENDWFYPYVGAAQKFGITNGIKDRFFGVKTEIIRQDAFVMLTRAVNKAGYSIKKERNYMEFRDNAQIDDYAMEAVTQLYSAGIVNGDDKRELHPKENLTRAEAAKIINGIMQEVGL